MGNNGLSDKDFNTLFLTYFRPLTIYALQYMKNQMVAEDIIHDLFMNLYENKETHNRQNLTASYLYRSVHNRCLNQLEHKKTWANVSQDLKHSLNPQSDNPFEIVRFIEFENKFMQTLELLSPKCKTIFEMSRIEGKKNQEIADELNLSKRTVETQIRRAMKIMRKKLMKYLPVFLAALVFLFEKMIHES